MRRGKECSQAAHASMGFLLDGIKNSSSWDKDDLFQTWITEGQTKITLQVSSEEELLSLYNQAKEAGLRSFIIRDEGATEFHGIKTLTSVAIGPNNSEDIDKLTSNLKLY